PPQSHHHHPHHHTADATISTPPPQPHLMTTIPETVPSPPRRHTPSVDHHTPPLQ
nr:hypothetical protein [Tanacetum cinerariifolium]